MTFDKGSSVLIEVEFKKQTPFGTSSYFDPTSSSITITDPDGTDVVSAAALTSSGVGQYYYICQTLVTWASGGYKVEVTASDGVNSDVTVDPQGFILEFTS